MSLPDDSEERIKVKHDELCSELNVDSETSVRSWDSYYEISQNFTLDGKPLHWLACTLYVACRSSITPTVRDGSAVEGNCVSLTKLLRLCNISLIQFFTKIKKWMEMASMSEEFRTRIESLERKFSVSTILFQKFQPICHDLFVGITGEVIKTPKAGKKHRVTACTANGIFSFCWSLFVCVKGEFQGSDDLVDMYHVLLACLDYVFGNAIMEQRTDLINPNFIGLPPGWNTEHFQLPSEAPCIIGHLCQKYVGLVLDAKAIKTYKWKPIMTKYLRNGVLKGDESSLLGILDLENFDSNFKSVNNLYETYVLSVGEFDERIFLGGHASLETGSQNMISGDEISRAIATFGTSGRCHAPTTPLTGRRYLRTSATLLTPVSAATQSIARLQAYLSGCKPEPGPKLLKLLQGSGVEEATIQSCMVEPCNAWASTFTSAYAPVAGADTAVARQVIVSTLHYKILHHILKEEKRKNPLLSMQTILARDVLHLSLYACCTEIVLHAYGVHSLRFPWVLKCFSIHAFHFNKIIELVVLAVMEKLSRDTVKHLNVIEEQVLESLVWSSESPLWEKIGAAVSPLPQWSDVCPANNTDVLHNSVPRRHNSNLTNVPQSPISSVSERFMSPNTAMAKKQLFRDAPIKPGQSLLAQNATTSNVSAPSSSITISNGTVISNNGQMANPDVKESISKSRVGSLGLFFRKFYSLASVRMQDLCIRLRLSDTELKQKIWTCLEHSIMRQTHLMKDRHLDQILMCAVYVICKVSSNNSNKIERTFTEIMRCYRQQPQADNHVYRSVFISSELSTERAQGDDSNSTEGSDNGEERGDLIKFYNKVYVQCMQSFALRFTGRQRDDCPLSPLPSPRAGGASPLAGQRVSEHHRLYVKPLCTPPPPNHQLTYRFSRSPAKDLRAINTMLSCEVSMSGVKRTLHSLEDEPVLKRPTLVYRAPVSRKLHGLITDRQAV